MRSRNHRTLLLVGLLTLSGLILIFASGIPSSADRVATQTIDKQYLTPAGSLVVDQTTRQPAAGSLPVDFVRSLDQTGPDNRGRYLIAVNSGYGIQFDAASNRGQQSLAVIDLNAKPAPSVIQNVYFPSPQSANVGVVFSPLQEEDGSYILYVSGGFENKIWMFRFRAGDHNPITPVSHGPNTSVEAPSIDVGGFSKFANTPRYNSDHLPVYPTGLAISADGKTLFVANNLGDSLGVISDLQGRRKLERIDLIGSSQTPDHATYPYAVVATPGKIYVSCWNDNSVAVVDLSNSARKVSYITVGSHPTAMTWNASRQHLFVVNSNDDTVSLIDTRADREIERINVRLSEQALTGNSPQGVCLNRTGDTLFVANARSNSIAVVAVSPKASRVRGFIPTGLYPSAVALAGDTLFVGNGKGTGVENSSLVVNNSGRTPNGPNERFPAGTGRGSLQGGQYSVSLVVGNISAIDEPDDPALARYRQQVMQNNGLLGRAPTKLFPGASPIKHVVYIIKENRTYDQIFGDVAKSGDGTAADGDATLAIFGAGQAAARPDATQQNITPNHRALALRFGLFDRFFVNSEASPDGHNWSTAAFSSDYVDKSYRWNYSRRGRTYDFEGFNRLPDYDYVQGAAPLFGPKATAEDIANYMRGFIPYLHNSHDVAEPQSLYLWDAATRAGLTYRNYGEFVATISDADVAAIRRNRSKSYPDISPTASAFPTKKALEGHFSSSYRNFDMDTPDSMTIDSYRAAVESSGKSSALINREHADERFRGTSRMGEWLAEFRGYVADRAAGRPDRFPNLSIIRLSNDHTNGLSAKSPTPQFYVADNDYALGLMVEAISNSPYWKDTAIVVLEDDAQDGPDHVDAHRSVGLVISAYSRPGALVHEFHSTVSFIRTIELLLGLQPMNQLDATAVPVSIFRSQLDLKPYQALLPNVALNNLMPAAEKDPAMAYWMRRSAEQDLSRQDMADPLTLNQIIWFSVKGSSAMPAIARLPAFDALRLGLKKEPEDVAERRKDPDDE
jgi:YVTN family beta-propeller protein